jgi:hypothetical protein
MATDPTEKTSKERLCPFPFAGKEYDKCVGVRCMAWRWSTSSGRPDSDDVGYCKLIDVDRQDGWA